jgi:sugar (pentulose or hexulose) kinase
VVAEYQRAIKKVNATGKFDPKNIAAIGIAYQMHGLVVVNDHKKFCVTASSGVIAVQWKRKCRL